jgi:LysM repeat protein
MKLPFFGRRDKEPAVDPVEEARRQALERLRARSAQIGPDAPMPAPAAPSPADPPGIVPGPEPVGGPPVAEEASDVGPDGVSPDAPPDFLRKDATAESGAESSGATEVPAADPQPAGEGKADDALSPDLLDIFRDAKNDVAETGLASEVEDVSLDSLLADLESVSKGLGLSKHNTIARTVKPEPEPELEAEAEEEPEPLVRVERVELPTPVVEPPADTNEEPELNISALVQHREPAEPAQPAPAPPPEMRAAPPADRGRGAGRGGALHLVFLGLALALAGGVGFHQAKDSVSLAREATAASPTPVVLMYQRTPAPVKPKLKLSASTKAPTASPSPTPSSTPTPTPVPTPDRTPRPTSNFQPPFFVYRVQSGDSLTSISQAFSICPDHILWNNPDRTETTPLRIGDRLLLPGSPGIVHEVRQNETLQAIALRYNVTPADITSVAANDVQSTEDLHPGMRILVPEGIPQTALRLDEEAEWAMTVPSADGYVWPFFSHITTEYGEVRANGWVHRAIDVGGLGNYGATVGAAADGTVIFAGEDNVYGKHVVIEHEDGSRTVYAHFSRMYVQEGHQVGQAAPVGAMGCTGVSTGTHLHFELWRNGSPVDPIPYLP